jgi:hypothetical protein
MALTWPDPPAPLVYWLWVAGDEGFIGASAAKQCLQSLEIMLTFLENVDVIKGSWASRVSKLMPPPRSPAGADHLTDFRATLFELLLCFQLLRQAWQITIEPDRGSSGCDISIATAGRTIVAIEAYAPQKGITDWFEAELATPWRALIAGTAGGPLPELAPDLHPVIDIFLDPEAVPRELSNILTSSNFPGQKAKQLAAGDVPTILAVRAYGLQPRIENLLTIRSRLDLAGAISQEAWDRLPERCIGILMCFTADVLLAGGPLMFLPAPGRSALNVDVSQFLTDVGALW